MLNILDNGTQIFRVDSGGKCTIGPSSGLTLYHTIQNSSSATEVLRLANNGTAGTWLTLDEPGIAAWSIGIVNASSPLQFRNSSGGGGTDRLILFTNGVIGVDTTNWGTGGTAIGVSGTVLTTSPSARKYKENEIELSFDTSKIFDVEVKEFDFKEGKGGAHDFGPIADDVDKILPQIVWKENDEPESIRESKVVWVLLEEMKKLKQQVEILEVKLNT